MKPPLENILQAILEFSYIDMIYWENYHKSRESSIIRAKELFCYISYKCGYNYKEIGGFLNIRKPTIERYIMAIQGRGCEGLIEDIKELLQFKESDT